MVDTKIAPYFDDYNPNKNYHKVLFTPRRGVQVRELNQLQTMLQEQVARFGDHVFENGSMVMPGEINHDMNYEYITVDQVNYVDIVEILGTNEVTVKGATSGVVAKIVQHLGNTQTDAVTLYIRYESSNGSTTPRFEIGEVVQLTTKLGIDFSTARVLTTGAGSVLTIEPGIFYINGNFIRSDKGRTVLSKYTSTPSVIAGFRLVEEAVSWTEDPTLVDNASGTSNSNAIGADRLKLTLVLEVHGLEEQFNRENFIELAKFREGVLLKKARGADYSILEDTLARRTYDQAGDYTVEPFSVRLREHLKTETNGGLYEGGDESKFVVGVEAGKAYVRGYEVENISTHYIDVDKARSTGTINNSSFSLPVGNYIEVSSLNILPRFNTHQTVTFYSDVPSSDGAIPAGTVLGTARVRLAKLKSNPREALLYLFNVRNAAGKNDSSFITLSKSVYAAGVPALTALVESELIDSINYSLLYPHVVPNVKSLLDAGVSDTSLTVSRQYDVFADGNGDVILSANGDEVFIPVNVSNSGASYTVSGVSTIREIASISTIGGSPVGKSLTISFGVDAAAVKVSVFVDVVKQTARHKVKTPTAATSTFAFASLTNRQFSLNKADAYKIVSVMEDDVDVTDSYELLTNVDSENYGISAIKLKRNAVEPIRDIKVTFMYYQHGAGDFFSVDSYSNIEYSDIPAELINGKLTSMSDVLDFRPRIDDLGLNYTGVGSSVTEVPSPYSIVRCDVENYLPRIDIVYATANRTFGITQGSPNVNPSSPSVPNNAMPLWILNVPAYTNDVSLVSRTIVNNRRYTMRDIGKLEKRIENVEYYTTLNMLENETNGAQIIDPLTGLNRFKNGFVVDNFIDHSVGALNRDDYHCAISSEDATLRSEFYADAVTMEYNSTTSVNTVLTGSLVTLPYTEVTFIDQPLASSTTNVNPYAVYRWLGSVKLIPAEDIWFDTVYTEPEVNYKETTNGVITQQWNSWGLNWTGALGSVTTRGGVTTTISVTDDRVIGQDVIPYMRSRKVRFSADGLLPLSRVYAFFDNVNVTHLCNALSATIGSPMFTDIDGHLDGEFEVPNSEGLRFTTGTKQFTLIDNIDNNKSTTLSFGDALYTAKGSTVTRTQSIAATRDISIQINMTDPLAQSFLVGKSGGVFLTSLEVFFHTKDDSTPITVEIRNVVNGYPGPDVLPYSVKTLKPVDVNISEDASAATKFVFDSPVYLIENQEYCFVIKSNSNNYNAWVATMGEKVVDSNDSISKQPFIGVLFKSQNNTAWTADQMSDLKFKINNAKFVTEQVGVADFDNTPIDVIRLSNNPIVSTDGSATLSINIPNHGLVIGSAFSISGVLIAPNIPPVEINGVRTVINVVDPDTVEFKSVELANSTGAFGGANVEVSRNLMMNTIQPIAQELLFENTNVNWSFDAVTGASIDGTESPYVPVTNISVTPNTNNTLTTPLMILSSVDATDKTSKSASSRLTASLITFSDNVSPAIDINRLGVIGISNRINSPDILSETAPIGGNACTRYINNIVGLKAAANSIKVYADVNKPQGSNVVVMYRTGNSEGEVESKDWVLIPEIVTSLATDRLTFNEFEYGANDIAPFTFYQFKIVLLSKSACKVPLVRRFRGIALGT